MVYHRNWFSVIESRAIHISHLNALEEYFYQQIDRPDNLKHVGIWLSAEAFHSFCRFEKWKSLRMQCLSFICSVIYCLWCVSGVLQYRLLKVFSGPRRHRNPLESMCVLFFHKNSSKKTSNNLSEQSDELTRTWMKE